jgi:hypothetical protein
MAGSSARRVLPAVELVDRGASAGSKERREGDWEAEAVRHCLRGLPVKWRAYMSASQRCAALERANWVRAEQPAPGA